MTEDRTIEHDNAGAYVADALDQQEREEFESHMAGCEVCTREVRDFAETFAELTFATQLTPPSDLRASVLTAIAKVRPLPALPTETAEPEPRVRRPRHALTVLPDLDEGPAPVAEPTRDVPEVAAVTQLADVRARRVRRVLSLAVAAAMVAAVALGISVVNLNQSAQRQQQVASAEAAVVTAPDAKVYPVSMQDGSKASYVVSKAQDRAVFIGADLAALPADKVYQLWTLPTASSFASAGTFTGSGEQRILISGGVDQAVAMGITIEPSNGGKGSTQPTVVPGQQPFAVAQGI